MRRIKRFFIPETSLTRAHTLRHEALFFYALFLFFLQFSLHYFAGIFPGVLGFASNITAKDVFESTNQQRLKAGLAPLRWDETLSGAAARKAQDMFAKGYWAHVAPDGMTPWSFVLKSGYDYLYAGENLAKDFQFSEEVVNAWSASPSHRENLLSPRYQDIGLAVVNGVLNGFETTLVVQFFGSRQPGAFAAAAKPSAPTPGTPVVTLSPTPTPTFTPTPAPEGQRRVGPQMEKVEFAPGIAMTPAAPNYSVPVATPPPKIQVMDVIRLSKTVSFVLGFFLLALFVVDGIVVVRRRHLRLSGHNLAHLSVLLLLLTATWYTSVGTVL